MMQVMKELEIPGLRLEVTVTPEPLNSKETTVISVIKAFNRSITPRLSNRDKYGFDAQRKTEFENNSKRPRVMVASSESQLVVELEKIGHSQTLPASDQPLGNSLIVLGPLRMKGDAMTVEIHDIERKEAAVVLDIARPYQIGLMDIVASQRIPEIGVSDSFGGIRRFF